MFRRKRVTEPDQCEQDEPEARERSCQGLGEGCGGGGNREGRACYEEDVEQETGRARRFTSSGDGAAEAEVSGKR